MSGELQCIGTCGRVRVCVRAHAGVCVRVRARRGMRCKPRYGERERTALVFESTVLPSANCKRAQHSMLHHSTACCNLSWNRTAECGGVLCH